MTVSEKYLSEIATTPIIVGAGTTSAILYRNRMNKYYQDKYKKIKEKMDSIEDKESPEYKRYEMELEKIKEKMGSDKLSSKLKKYAKSAAIGSGLGYATSVFTKLRKFR